MGQILIMMIQVGTLGFSRIDVERSNRAARTGSLTLRQFDFAELLFILLDVVLQGEKQTLGMFGSHYNAASYFCLLHAGHHADKVADDFARRVGDYGQVAINAGGHFWFQLNLELLVFLFVCHNDGVIKNVILLNFFAKLCNFPNNDYICSVKNACEFSNG